MYIVSEYFFRRVPMIIEMFPAENGDAFLVRLDNGENILIDMGYNETYRNL